MKLQNLIDDWTRRVGPGGEFKLTKKQQELATTLARREGKQLMSPHFWPTPSGGMLFCALLK